MPNNFISCYTLITLMYIGSVSSQTCSCILPTLENYGCSTSNAGPVPWCSLCTKRNFPGCSSNCGCTSTCDVEVHEKKNVACSFGNEMCPNIRSKQSPDTVDGHFISGSLAWRATEEKNTVVFEIQSTWRLSFVWPVPNEGKAFTGPCGFPGLGDTVQIVGQAQNQSGNEFSVQAGLDTGALPPSSTRASPDPR